MALQCGSGLAVQEDGSDVVAGASAINFLEPDAALVSAGAVGVADVNMALYALLSGRSGGQRLHGGPLSGDPLELFANPIDAAGRLTLDGAFPHADLLGDFRLSGDIFDAASVRQIDFQQANVGIHFPDPNAYFSGEVGIGDALFTIAPLDMDEQHIGPPRNTFRMVGNHTLDADFATHTLASFSKQVTYTGRTGTTSAGFNFGGSVFGGTITERDVFRLLSLLRGGAVVTTFRGVEIGVAALFNGSTAALWQGIHLADQGNAGITLVESLAIDDTTAGATQRLMEVGPVSPYLRLVGGAVPAANQTNLFLDEGGTLRHVQWLDPGFNGANFAGGERVMVLV